MKMSITKKELYATLSLEDEKLTSANVADLKTEFVLITNEGYKNIILDIQEVNFVDSSGLSSILVGNRLCKEANGTFVLVGPQENIKQLLSITQIERVLIILPTVQEAEDYVKMDELTRQISEESDSF